MPGKVHERLKDAYPGKPRQQNLVQASFRAEPGQPVGLSMQQELFRVLLVDEQAKKFQIYFQSWPTIPPGLPQNIDSFLTRAEHRYDDGVRLVSTFARSPAPETHDALFVIDLELTFESASRPLSVAEALAKADDLHEREGLAFEALLTEETRKVFDA